MPMHACPRGPGGSPASAVSNGWSPSRLPPNASLAYSYTAKCIACAGLQRSAARARMRIYTFIGPSVNPLSTALLQVPVPHQALLLGPKEEAGGPGPFPRPGPPPRTRPRLAGSVCCIACVTTHGLAHGHCAGVIVG